MTSSEGAPSGNPKKIAVLWDTFGPQHVDRLNDVAKTFPALLGVELFGQSHEYDWSWTPERRFESVTLSKVRRSPFFDGLSVIRTLVQLRIGRGIDDWFLCHYERPYILVGAWLLRLLGARVFIMQDSRFEDKPRRALAEWIKSFFYGPYAGAISATTGTTAYLRYLGLKGPIAEGYDTGSVARISSYAPKGEVAFRDRPFLFVARLLEQKNPVGFMTAYADYVAKAKDTPRPLVMIGSGPEEAAVKRIAEERGVLQHITFIPWANQPDVVAHMGRALYLFLPSVMEPFGNVVGEAACVGLPAVLSDVCGARDLITRDFVSGFTLPANDAASWSEAMVHLAEDEALWRRMRAGALAAAPAFDSARFVDAIEMLTASR
ncbi:MAG: glycosyltransferase family 4 protein [Hyphomonadaceae bacterium]|nr:MAG: putative Glycosyl transferase group 1 [Caulobacteraceae bacterium]MBT9446296.1 glycosyltransferase family 4 protein [Hyphomonadaceae bacterium]TPW08867.1 MAG: putative Glycosyl transferase, group 1 [Alphaproteobacteria bacterium]